MSVAAHRLGRTFLPVGRRLPAVPEPRPGYLTEIPSDDYDVVVFENRFPSFVGIRTESTVDTGLFEQHPAWGRCEVVCFTPDHDASFAEPRPTSAHAS